MGNIIETTLHFQCSWLFTDSSPQVFHAFKQSFFVDSLAIFIAYSLLMLGAGIDIPLI